MVILGTGALGERALDGTAIVAALRATGLDRVLLVKDGPAEASHLGRVPAAGVRTTWDEREEGVPIAAAAKARRLVLEPPTELSVEDACRQLFAFARRHAGLAVALLPAAAGPLSQPAGMAFVLDDLKSLSVGFWHRPARAHLLGGRDADWLDPLARFVVGMSLDDVAAGEAGLPPGVGDLDFGPVAELSARAVDVALDVGPLSDVALLRVSVARLRQDGFP